MKTIPTVRAAAALGAAVCFSLSPGSKATADAAPGPARVMVAAYYGKYFGGVAADPKWMAAHADFVEGEAKTLLAFKKAGGRYGMFYTDPFRVIVANKEPYWDLPESAWLHDAQRNRISAPYRNGTVVQYFLNPAAPETQAAFAATTKQAKETGAYDFIFLDDVTADIRGHIYPSADDPEELRSDNDLVEAIKPLIMRSALPVIFNGLTNIDKALGRESLTTQFNDVAAGGLAEGCFTNVARFKLVPSWISDAESLLATTTQGKWAICAPGSKKGSENAARLYAYASWLMTYDKAHSVIRENIHTPSRVLIFPEQSFVPTNPLISPHHIRDLKQSSGSYIREFSQCYYQGKAVGACAAVVNPEREPVTIPGGYSKQMVLVGDGSWDGGSLIFQTTVPSSLASGSAAILVR